MSPCSNSKDGWNQSPPTRRTGREPSGVASVLTRFWRASDSMSGLRRRLTTEALNPTVAKASFSLPLSRF